MTETLIENDAAKLWQRLGQNPAQAVLWLSLARSYAGHGLPWQAGYAARQALRFDATLAPALQALDIGTWQDATAGDAELGRPTLDGVAALAERFAARVNECPGDWLTWLYLARLLEMQALTPGDALHRAQAFDLIPGESLHWLGVWRLNAGDAQGAVAALSGLLDIRPVRFGGQVRHQFGPSSRLRSRVPDCRISIRTVSGIRWSGWGRPSARHRNSSKRGARTWDMKVC